MGKFIPSNSVHILAMVQRTVDLYGYTFYSDCNYFILEDLVE
jgi:hypothetical protein